MADGRVVTTVEGLATRDGSMQFQAFLTERMQSSYCTSGMVLAAVRM